MGNKIKSITNLLFIIIGLLFSSSLFANTDTNKPFQFVCSEWPPFEYKDENNKITGYSVEILQAILEELSVEDNIKIYPWKRVLLIVNKDINTLAFTMARTPARENTFKWVGPIAKREIYLWKLKDRKDIIIENWSDVQKYTIGTVRGDAAENQLKEKGFIKGKNIDPVNTQLQNYKKLYNKRVDLMYGLELSTIYGVTKAGLDTSALEKSLFLSGDLNYYYAFNINTSDETVLKFNNALEKIKNNGVFDSIVRKYSTSVNK
ncbi:MAG: transporter substrate-binding domain-containing protein [Francisellaceae bacterium]|jgi:polar amino acid transport system substrate-binding protein|nr:transporter substrate-binding domain-containing protein [Francisellaceae bacterium]